MCLGNRFFEIPKDEKIDENEIVVAPLNVTFAHLRCMLLADVHTV